MSLNQILLVLLKKKSVTQNFYDEHLQISVFESEDLRVVSLYRSTTDKNIVRLLTDIIPDVSACLIIGDINICSRAAAIHPDLALLRQKGFNLLVSEATHFGGGALDQAWLRSDTSSPRAFITQIYSPYYNADHDALLLTYNPQKKISK